MSMRIKMIGQSWPRLDARAKVTGQAVFPADLYVEGMLHAKVLWSEHPHARIRGIVTGQAEAHPGVVAVLTYRDVPVNEYGITGFMDQRVLAQDKVRSVGDPVALVIAESERLAEQARRLIRVDYEPLPVVTDPREAMKPEAPLVHEEHGSNILKSFRIRKGDVATGFAQADVIVEGEYHTPHHEHAYLQPEAGLALIDEEGRVTVYVAAQWAHDDVHQIAHALDLPEDRVREVVTAIGGAFGGREDISLQILLALAAYKTGRPVKMEYDRQESIRGHGKRHPYFMRHKTGATREGRLTAMEIELIADAGAYASTSIPVMANSVSFATGPYEVPHVRVDAHTVYTNNTVTMAMRGFGSTQPPVAYEQQMDRLAEALGMDPVELRLKNLYQEGSIAATGLPLPPGVGIRQTLVAAAQAAGWREESGHWTRPQKGTKGVEGSRATIVSRPKKLRGIGVACAYKNVGYSLGFDDQAGCRAELHLDEQGRIGRAVINIGASEVGQGVTTALAQIAAETLGLPLERVEMRLSDTALVPDAGSSSASRHVYVSGNAVQRACLAALEKRDAALRAEEFEGPIVAHYLFRGREARPTTPYDPETGRCDPHLSYGWVTNVAEVEVDAETGQVEVLKVWAAQDVGRAINPQMIEGQVDGGVVMGEGFALMEEYIQQEGRIKTRKFSEYPIPTALDIPWEIVPLIVEVPDPTGPGGAKGVGEMTTIGVAPAILNALHDATGVWFHDLPVTAEKILLALKEQGKRGNWGS